MPVAVGQNWVIGFKDGSIGLFRSEPEKAVMKEKAHSGPVGLLAADDLYLASAGRDRLVRIWKVQEVESQEPAFKAVSAFLTDGIVTALAWVSRPDIESCRYVVYGDSRGKLGLLKLEGSQGV